METNLFRYIIRRSFKLQSVLIATIFLLAAINPLALDLKKNFRHPGQSLPNRRQARKRVVWFCLVPVTD